MVHRTARRLDIAVHISPTLLLMSIDIPPGYQGRGEPKKNKTRRIKMSEQCRVNGCDEPTIQGLMVCQGCYSKKQQALQKYMRREGKCYDCIAVRGTSGDWRDIHCSHPAHGDESWLYSSAADYCADWTTCKTCNESCCPKCGKHAWYQTL